MNKKETLSTYNTIFIDAENSTEINNILNNIDDSKKNVNYAIRRHTSTNQINVAIPISQRDGNVITNSAAEVFDIKENSKAVSTNGKYKNSYHTVFATGLVTPYSIDTAYTLHALTYRLDKVNRNNVKFTISDGSQTESGLNYAELSDRRTVHPAYAITKISIPRI